MNLVSTLNVAVLPPFDYAALNDPAAEAEVRRSAARIRDLQRATIVDIGRELTVRDYHSSPEPLSEAQMIATLDELGALSDTELLDFTTLAKVFGYPTTVEAQDSAVSPRGYRALDSIPRLQFAHSDLLVRTFGTLQNLLAASANDLQSVEGIGGMWARHVRGGLSQAAESTIADPLN